MRISLKYFHEATYLPRSLGGQAISELQFCSQ